MTERVQGSEAGMRIVGLEEAVGDYRKAKAGRWFSGSLMYDKCSGRLWTDFSYDADMSWIRDQGSDSVINIGEMMLDDTMEGLWGSAEVSAKNVSEYIVWKFSDEGDTDEQH